MNLKGKVCLVTGGSSGIGAATAVTLARKGAHIAVVARKVVPLPDSLLAAVEAHGTKARFVEADVAEAEACRKCVEQVVQEFGRLDVLVHSAGGPVPGGFYAVSDESWMNAFAVHVHSVFWMSRAAAPHIAKQGGGAIILLGSAAGLRGCLGAFAYGVVKGALPQFARVLGRELAEQRIRVNCVSPGVIRTPFHDALSPEAAKNNIENRIPLHIEGKPEDVAALIATLVENDFITGENMVIDGGMTMRIV
jgi:NAD(P)-dependent dehydrogenase (short-subunit alcohol dehydrogenase family)